jgi:FKBP-type peptidyl-prolyl cis-trans isomerase SlyD
MTESGKVDDGQVVAMHYTLHVDGEMVDTSKGAEPLQFIQGMGHIIPGLERQIYDMQVGESKRLSIEPQDGYGEMDIEAFMDVPCDSFPGEIPMEVGTQLELKDKSGHPSIARIDAVTGDHVRLNMNHPLAGKRLDFEITIESVRPATEDEVSHGHVHTHEHD